MTIPLNEQIKKDIERNHPRYGEITISLIFHDGRITSYTITTSERHNMNQNFKTKGDLTTYENS